MAGKPGMKGGGGARPNSGPEKNPPKLLDIKSGKEPLEFLEAVMNDENADGALRVRAAITVAQYKHTKRKDGGKKEEKQRAAETASSGKFGPAAPPVKAATRH